MGKDRIKGGLADGKTVEQIASRHGVDVADIQAQLRLGEKTELEHTSDRDLATEIAMDHLWEDPKYYDKLKKVEESFLRFAEFVESKERP